MDKPHHLYRHFGANNELLYVGIALYPVARTKWHRSLSPWFSDIRAITVEELPDRTAALSAERAAIIAECPKYNIHHKPRASRSQMTRAEAAAIGNRVAAERRRAETMKKLRPARSLWRDKSPKRLTVEQITAQVGLSAKTLYEELGRRPAIRKKGKSDE